MREGGRLRLVFIGAVAAAAVTTKAYGVFFVFPPLSVVAWISWRRYGSRELLSESRFPIAGGAAVLALIYLPFVFVPHPSVPGGYGGDSASGPSDTRTRELRVRVRRGYSSKRRPRNRGTCSRGRFDSVSVPANLDVPVLVVRTGRGDLYRTALDRLGL